MQLFQSIAKFFSSLGSWIAEQGDFLEWFTALGPWVAGVGTLITAVVALYLAYVDRRINIIGVCEARMAFNSALPSCTVAPAGPAAIRTPIPASSAIWVLYMSATNVGFRSVTISGVSLRIKKRMFAKRAMLDDYVFTPNPGIPVSSGIPIILAAGETAAWMYEIEHTKKQLMNVLLRSKKDAKALVCEFRTNHRKNIVIKPDQGWIRTLVDLLP